MMVRCLEGTYRSIKHFRHLLVLYPVKIPHIKYQPLFIREGGNRLLEPVLHLVAGKQNLALQTASYIGSRFAKNLKANRTCQFFSSRLSI